MGQSGTEDKLVPQHLSFQHEKERIVKPIIFLLFPASYLLLINLCPLLIGKTKRREALASTELRLLESRLCCFPVKRHRGKEVKFSDFHVVGLRLPKGLSENYFTQLNT